MINRPVYFIDRVVPARDAKVNFLSATAQYGLNVFEGVRGYYSPDNGFNIFRLHEHIARLYRSLKIIGLRTDVTEDQIFNAISLLLQEEVYRQCDMSFRVTFFVDEDVSWSSRASAKLMIAPLIKPRVELQNDGVKVKISSYKRISDENLSPRVKAGCNYVSGRYSHLEALDCGFDVSLLLDSNGNVAESTGSCIMMIKNGTLLTPSLNGSILDSITRSSILSLASDLGYKTRECDLSRTQLYDADEIFLCGTSAEIIFVSSIDHMTGFTNFHSRLIASEYFNAVDGKIEKYKCWNSRFY